MKKIFMIVMLLFTTVVGYSKEVSNVDASDNSEYITKEQTSEMYDFDNFDIMDYNNILYLTDEQQVKVNEIMDTFSKKMNESFYAKNRKKKAIKTINKNIDEMCNVLGYFQYRMYLRILNLEFNRRGIDLN